MLIYIFFFIPLRASKQLLSELINIHNLSFAIGRSASNVQPALININELDLGNSRTRNLVSSPSHSAAASGTEEEPSRRHTGARYRTLPPVLLLFLALSLARLLLVLATNEWYMLYGPPTDRKEAPHSHTAPEITYYASNDNKSSSCSELPRPCPGTDWAFGALCLI